jgi:hypothetical protein
MPFDKPIRRVAVIGTGVIGASWAAQYLARGLDASRPIRLPTPRPICANMSTRPGHSSKKSVCRRAHRASPSKIGTAIAQQSVRGALSFCNSPLMGAPDAYIQFTPGLITEVGGHG